MVIYIVISKRFMNKILFCYVFSVKSGSSDKDNLDNLLKTIAKDSMPSINDANNSKIR